MKILNNKQAGKTKVNSMLHNNYFSKKLTPVMDLDYDLSCAFHTPEILENKIKMLAEHGFKRLHIVAPPPGNPDYSHAARLLPEDGPTNFLRQSRVALGDNPLKLAIRFAKCADLEVIVVFKPYEGGGVFTIPHGAIPDCGQNYMETLGGRAIGLDPFIVEHPEFLLQRRPCKELHSKLVTRIELVFILDRISDENAIKQQVLDNDVISRFPANGVKIYSSSDNGIYKSFETPFTVEECIEPREIKDANGEPVFPQPMQCRIITISGLKIDAPYFAVSFDGDEKAFRTIPFSMCTVFSGDRETPATVSPSVRHHIFKDAPSFTENGFEFEEVGPYYWDCGWRTCTCFGFARGKIKYLRGSLCEAYPEVRKHWLNQIKSYIEMGADGIEIRLQSHCSGVTDFVNYGFNTPLVKAYSDEYGINILSESVDPIKLMKIRGNIFTIFIEDAKTLVHKNKVKLLLHLHAYMEHPSLNPTFHELGFWANPKILPDWRKLIEVADEIVLKDYNFGQYNPEVASEIKNFAYKTESTLWIHCYLQQGHDWNPVFIKAVGKDLRISGILLYEVVWNDRENDGIIRVDTEGQLFWMLSNSLS
jgi:hypothetical protein